MSFFYKGCEFEPETSCFYSSKYKIHLKSVSGSVLEIPCTCNGEVVRGVNVCSSNRDSGLEYFEPDPDKFAFHSVEEIRIPESIEYIMLNRMIFPNLKRVIVDPNNKNYVATGDYLIQFSEPLGTVLVAYYGNSEEFMVPDNINSLGSFSFSFTNLRSIVFTKRFKCDSIDPFLYSKWLENFESAIELDGKVLAFKKEIDEFIIKNSEQLCSSTFQYAIPERVVLDSEQLSDTTISYVFEGFHCVELRNPKAIMKGYFAYCITKSESIVVNPENEHYCSMDGVLFTKDRTKLLVYPQFKKDKEYVVPEGVIEIDANAFSANSFCEVIKLPTTLRKLCPYNTMKIDGEITFASVKEFILPELAPSFRFYNIYLGSVQHFRIPASILALPSNSFVAPKAVVDATENQCFMNECVICKELLISEKMRFADRGAFCGVCILHAPEYKIFNFVETLFPTAITRRNHFSCIHYLIVTKADGKLLRLALPILTQQGYKNAIYSFWSVEGISIEKYLDAILKIKDTKMKYSALYYFMKNNEEFRDLLFSRISKILNGLIAWLIENRKFELISVLCKSGMIKPALAKRFLQKNLSNELIPVFMNVLQSSKKNSLSL